MTNHLSFRLIEHYVGINDGFSSEYNTYYLVWFEETKYVLNAIAREKEIKSWTRQRKVDLIEEVNPLWHHLNEEIVGNWPPTEAQIEDMFTYRKHEEERLARIKKNDDAP
jgi:putative endonuclease